ncbi:hypothetical protein [Sphingomonas sp. 28-63-12]|uniref:hypothetical protein n=1 Tax=Sphingomonas sp. 28-63-12 TaxID=1970434 RepID=UPI000BC41323|nr:MAG: hypothetical protein B7Y47_03685 [Sphingomonas sp. 28-63-12]
MTTFSKAAFAAALMIGASTVIAVAPAEAKKEQPPKGPVLSAEFRKPALEAQTALKAKDMAAAEPAVIAAEAAAKSDDEIYFAQIFRLQLENDRLQGAAKGDPAAYRRMESVLIKPLNALVANAKTEPRDRARYTFRLGLIEYDQKHYAEAAALLQKARDLGETDPDLQLSLVKARIEGGDVLGGAGDMQKAIDAEIAAGRKPPETWYDYIIPRLAQADRFDDFITWSQNKLKQYPSAKNWRTLIIYYGFSGKRSDTLDKQQKIDLFRLLRANNALADLADYSQYALYLNSSGLPVEAKAVLDEGTKSGKMALTRDDDKALYAAATSAIKLDGPVSAREAKAKAAATGVSAAAAGDAYLGDGNYAKAVELYKVALGKGVTKPDEVNTRLGIAYALLHDMDNARAAFALVKSKPRDQIAAFWLGWLDLGGTPAAS